MILVDTHVHIYPCYHLNAFFDAAYDNFVNEATRQGVQDFFTSFLLLTDLAEEKWFDRLKTYTGADNTALNNELGGWRIKETDEPFSLQLMNSRDKNMYLVAGRQITTLEKLEVLALFSDHGYADGQSIDETIESVRKNDAIPVIPWGAGKWLGKRGALLMQILNKYPANYFLLGDNGGRPRFWPSPKLFKHALSYGTQILPGSDPLPLVNESRRPGSYGCTMTGIISPDTPGNSLKQLIADSEIPKTTYGKRHGLSTVIANQVALRVREELNSRP